MLEPSDIVGFVDTWNGIARRDKEDRDDEQYFKWLPSERDARSSCLQLIELNRGHRWSGFTLTTHFGQRNRILSRGIGDLTNVDTVGRLSSSR